MSVTVRDNILFRSRMCDLRTVSVYAGQHQLVLIAQRQRRALQAFTPTLVVLLTVVDEPNTGVRYRQHHRRALDARQTGVEHGY